MKKSESRGQRAEVRDQKSEIRVQSAGSAARAVEALIKGLVRLAHSNAGGGR